MEEHVAPVALKDVKVGPHLPIDLAPRDSVGFPDKGHKLLEVPRLVDDMLGSDLSVTVDIGLGLGAVEHLSLAHGEQFAAVGTLIEVVALLLEQKL